MVHTRCGNWYRTFYLLLVFLVVDGRSNARAQARPPRTVLDYYLLLPGDYFGGLMNPQSRSERLKWLRGGKSVVDNPDGYLYLHGDGAQQAIEMCIFRRPDHTYLTAVACNYASDGDWEPTHYFYTYRNGRLVDVTRRVLPIRIRKSYGMKLPRYGKTIQVINSKGRRIYDLVWLGDRFQVRGL